MANNLSWTFQLLDQMSGPANNISNALGAVGGGLRRMGTVAGAATRVLGGVAAAGTGIVATLGSIATVAGGGAAVAMLSSAENTRLALTSMLGSTEKATNAMQYAIDLARTTPLEVGDVVKSMQRLIQQGFAPNQIDPLLRGLADMGAQMGMTGADVNDLVTIIGQIKMKPKLQAEELLQLAERGVPAYQMLAKQLGVTEGQVVEMASKGMISGTTAVAALTRGMEMFSGASQRNSTTLSGLLSTLQSIPQEFFLQMDIQSARGGTDLLAPVRTLLSNIAEIFDFNKEPGASIFKEASGAISGLIKAVFGPLATSSDPKTAGKVVMDFIQGLKAFGAEVAPIFNAVKDVVSVTFPIFADLVKAVWPVIKGLVTFFSTLVTGKQGADGFGKAANSVTSAVQSIGAWFQRLWAQVSPILSDLWTIAQAVFKGISWAWQNILQPAIGAIGQAFMAAWGVVSPILSTLWATVSGVIGAVAAIIRGDWSAAFQAMGNVVRSIWEGIRAVFAGMGNFIKTVGAGLFNTLLEVGGNIVNGLLQGITGGIGLIWEGIQNLGNAAINGIKSLLGIASPSKVFADLGLQTAAGMEQGLMQGMGAVNAAGQNLANSALPAVIPLPGIDSKALQQSISGGLEVASGAAAQVTRLAPTNPTLPAPGRRMSTDDKLTQLEQAIGGIANVQARQSAVVAPKVTTLPVSAPVTTQPMQMAAGGIEGPVTININVTANNTEPKGVAEQIKVIAVSAILEALEGASMEGGLWQTSS